MPPSPSYTTFRHTTLWKARLVEKVVVLSTSISNASANNQCMNDEK